MSAQENTGQITRDSLAADSLRAGGDFASGQAAVSSVPSGSTTANTTDASGATVLAAAPYAASRDDADFSTRDFAPTASDPGRSAGYDSARGAPAQNVGVAPSYVAAGGVAEEMGRPKGRNLTEGGPVDVDAPNASFNNEIGTKKDPGRLAEQGFQKANARSGGDAGYEGVGAGGSAMKGGQGGFEALRRDESA